MRGRLYIVLVAMTLGLIFWVLDAFLDYLVLGKGSFSDQLFFISSHELYLRSFVVLAFLFAGITVSEMSVKHKAAENNVCKKEKDLSFLCSTASIAADSLEFDVFLNDILNELLSYLDADYGLIYLIDRDSGEAMIHADFAIPPKLRASLDSMPSDGPLISYLRQVTHQRKNINQPFVISSHFCFCPQSEIDDCIAFPLISRNILIGFFLISVNGQDDLSDGDIHVLESVAKHVGTTIENMQLLEEATCAYDELKSIDKMKDEFVSNITHELKTPLISIKGYSEVMYEGMLGELTDKQKEAMKTVISNSERLYGLIESLLHMNTFRFEKNHVFSPVVLTDILESSINGLTMGLEGKQIKLRRNYSGNLHLVYGNGDFLKQLFIYLIDNAIKFSPDFSKIDVSAFEEGDMMHIEVSDNGIGIPAVHMDRIFDRFYQVDGSMTRNYGGSGLGLFLARNIIDVHKGNIWAESSECIGTRLHVQIPLYDTGVHSDVQYSVQESRVTLKQT
ncbi:GAF domain-containing sensor histidine kinase [Methanolobus sp. ZRKC3]|uniref:ATP-binding protein n=1 Tax=Methanolobus sp. ZRKC3 TaxID=3125786 RepID=UPI0032439C68